MAPTSLSLAARALREYLADELDLDLTQVTIGHPGGTARDQDRDGGSGVDLLNLFFYRIERDAYPSDGPASDPFYVRAFCLLTAFCHPLAGANGASAGERDLQLIGGVMERLHARPRLRVRQDGTDVAELQVVMHALQLDDINHIWATQGDLPYRLSVSYEFALLPFPIGGAIDRSPRVGALGLSVGAHGAPDERGRSGSIVPARVVDTRAVDWAPVLRFVVDGALLHALALPTGTPRVTVVGAGRIGDAVQLTWERWDNVLGWRPLDGRTPLVLATDRVADRLGAGVAATQVELPERAAGQLQLTAIRTIPGPDGASRVVRSGPLLISLHEVA